ncbi:MAG: hypothetical protein II280_04825, partial [Lachnospiraceae bacterium]|nr:hypothetical protein [Lachnospiraceae bacterium]
KSSRAEEMLFELMGKFSYESMLSEIRRTVRAEMEREAEAREPQIAVAPVMPVVPAEPVAAEIPMEPIEPAEFEEPEVSVFDVPTTEESLEDFFGLEGIDMEEADAMAAFVAEEIRTEEQREEERLEEEAEPVFDIMQLLAAEAEKLANVSPIDMMDTYGEMVIEITLEELVQYNNAQRNKRITR